MSHNSGQAKAIQNYRETNVLFIWEVNDRLKQYLMEHLRDISEVQLIFPADISPESLLKLAPSADIIVGWRPSKDLLLAATRLTLFVNPGAGVQHLIELFRTVNQTRKATQTRPIRLANGHGNSYFTAQHVVALLLSLANKIIPHHNWMRDGFWRKRDDEARSIPIRSRQIGLLGYGAINQKVHRFLAGFDVEFAILRRTWDDQSIKLPTPAQRFTPLELHAFLEKIDTLLIAVPLTSMTRAMIGAPELDLLGPEGLLVNVGRGEIVNQGALFSALKEKRIAGAALDVWYDYQPEPDDQGRKFPYKEQEYPFHRLEHVVLSPHRGASPLNDLQRWNEVIENISQFARGTESFINLVDLDREY